MWRPAQDGKELKTTVWSPMNHDTDYYQPSEREFMVNYRVEDLEQLLNLLREEGVEQVGEMQCFDYGKFAWILDPDGTKIELWEPANEHLFDVPPMIHSK